MFKNRKFLFVLLIAILGSVIGLFCWIYITDADTTRLFEFGIWAGFGTMVPGLLFATGASENTFEEGDKYDAFRDASQKQERIRGTVPVLVITVLAGSLIIAITFFVRFVQALNA